MILPQLGIYGWKEHDENLVLASLLTGDPLLVIGNQGCAKTHLANGVAEALDKRFLVYDASKAMFEDVLGYPNVEKLKQGVVEYVPSRVTVCVKELIFIDELNRAKPPLTKRANCSDNGSERAHCGRSHIPMGNRGSIASCADGKRL